METSPHDIAFRQGATYRETLQIGIGHLNTLVTPNVYVIDTPYNFVGCTVKMQLRKKHGETVVLEVTEVASINGQVTAGVGSIAIWLSDEGTRSLQDAAGKTLAALKYDIMVTYPSGDVDYPVAGTVTVAPNITVAI